MHEVWYLHGVASPTLPTSTQVGPVLATFRALAPVIAAPRVKSLWPEPLLR